jgi:DNA-binding NarL/FixJ family response regulator/type II secretory pathway predicted ATPase ExeA
LTGRQEELAFVLATLDDPAAAGVLVVGATGVGKTRLAQEALAEARLRNLATVYIGATRAMSSIPFGAVVGLVPVDVPASAGRLEFFRAACRALAELAGQRQLVITVDDAHHLDEGTAALLLHVVVTRAARVVVTVRSGEPCPDAVTALWKENHVARLDLSALSGRDGAAMAEAHLGGPLDQRACRWIAAASDGRPLYVHELVAGAVESGALRQAQGRWRLERSPPASPRLVDLVATNLGALDEAEHRAMAAIALAEPIDLPVLDLVADLDAVARLERRQLVVVSGTSGQAHAKCAHPLYSEVVVGQMAEAARRSLRQDLAAALERIGTGNRRDALLLATWKLEADDTPDPRLLADAAREAVARFDYNLAARLARTALAAGAGIDAAMTLCSALSSAGDHHAAAALLFEWEGRASSEPESALYLAHCNRTLNWALGRYADAYALLDRAESWWPTTSWRDTVDAVRAFVLQDEGRFAEALAIGLPLIDAPELNDEARHAVIGAVAFALLRSGQTLRAQAIAGRAIESASRLGQRPRASVWSVVRAWMETRLQGGRDWDGVDALLEELGRRVMHGASVVAGALQIASGRVALHRGRVPAAQQCFREALLHVEAAGYPPNITAWTLMQLSQVEAMAGDTAAAEFSRARIDALGAGRRWQSGDLTDLAVADVWIAASRGDLPRAQELALASADEQGESVVGEAALRHLAVLVGASAAAVSDRLGALAASADSALLQAQAAHVAALARGDGGALDAAASTFEEIGACVQAACAYAHAAAAHRVAGSLTSSRNSAAHGARLARTCQGAGLRAVLPPTADVPLSRREREIALLAAHGLSNQEIAARVHLSVRTVESHIYRASVKLGVTRREQLADFLD